MPRSHRFATVQMRQHTCPTSVRLGCFLPDRQPHGWFRQPRHPRFQSRYSPNWRCLQDPLRYSLTRSGGKNHQLPPLRPPRAFPPETHRPVDVVFRPLLQQPVGFHPFAFALPASGSVLRPSADVRQSDVFVLRPFADCGSGCRETQLQPVQFYQFRFLLPIHRN